MKGTEKVISKINKMLSKAPIKPAEILNFFSSQFFFFFDFALLGFSGKIPAKFFNS
jgi:hypothetical protein